MPAATQMEKSKSHASVNSSSFARAKREIPEEKTVIPAKVMAFSPRALSSKRRDRYSGTLRALLP